MVDDNNIRRSITIKILDRTLVYSVRPEEEGLIRNAVANISKKLTELKDKHRPKDNQEALTIVLIQIASQFERDRADDEAGALAKEIELLDSQLDTYIKNEVNI